MKLTEAKIKRLSSQEYNLYKKEIRLFYKQIREQRAKLRLKHLNKKYVRIKLNRTYWDIHSRCNNSKRDNYKYYGGRGIKLLMTKEELKKLWYRDKAYLMIKSSIHRKDNNSNYTYENCQFIELSKNISKKYQ